jgi:hypothetical protein
LRHIFIFSRQISYACRIPAPVKRAYAVIMTIRSAFLAIFLSVLGNVLRAGVGTDGAAFLEIPVGARAGALGGAYDPLATDSYAPFWNPAGLGHIQEPELSASHLTYIQDISYQSASLVHPIPKGGAFGGSFQYLYPGRLNGTDINGNQLEHISGYYAQASLSAGRIVTERVALGVTGKVIRSAIDGLSAEAYAMDVGSLFRVGNRTTLSAVMANIGSKMRFIRQSDPLPTQARLGAAYHAAKNLDLSAVGVRSHSGTTTVHAGAEWRPYMILALRTGYRTDIQKELSGPSGVTMGLGLQWSRLGLDYGWVPMGQLGHTHYLSLNIGFTSSEE